jgi:alpha-galactosidase
LIFCFYFLLFCGFLYLLKTMKQGSRVATFLVLAQCQGVVTGLDNGLGLTPAMGYSTWNDCGSFRNNGPAGWCWNAENHVKNITQYFLSHGLADLGYTQINIDEGWLKGRNASGMIYEDFEKFPSGMKELGTWIKAQVAPKSGKNMRYGLYTSRGVTQCGQSTYSAPGSHGYEKADVDWMVSHAGAQYLKVDSCGGSQDHSTAFSDYAKFRDALNATGVPVYFSLCGWHDWYAPPDQSISYAGGASLGNSWRIAGDGSGWGPLSNCINTQAAVASYGGPGGWNDPDLLIGPEVYVGGQTDEQARAQFTLWSIFPTNLIISQNVLQWSDYALETYVTS